MRILYGIQGTGNGHISRAKVIIPELVKHAEVDLLLSGHQSELTLDYPVKFRFKGINLVFGSSGGINFNESIKQTSLKHFVEAYKNLDLSAYDVVLSDFEPVSAWAARSAGVPCIHMSNQSAITHPDFPVFKGFDFLSIMVLKHFAPSTITIPLFYQKLGEDFCLPPISSELDKSLVSTAGSYVVYLPAYSDEEISKTLSLIYDQAFTVFSKQCEKPYQVANCRFRPIHAAEFKQALISAEGIISAAGYSSTSEALHLGKKLLVVPMKGQYEQAANAKALKSMGVQVIKKLKKKKVPKIKAWIEDGKPIETNWEENTRLLVDEIIKKSKGLIAQEKEHPHYL